MKKLFVATTTVRTMFWSEAEGDEELMMDSEFAVMKDLVEGGVSRDMRKVIVCNRITRRDEVPAEWYDDSYPFGDFKCIRKIFANGDLC